MNILSLFDGISCGQLAAERAKLKVDNYYASEIDKYAIKVTMNNYPNTIQLGDIKNWKSWDIDFEKIDLIIGGSPCQGFSTAGKMLKFEDERSLLFFDFVDILNYCKSKNNNVKFLLENVQMDKKSRDVISNNLKVEPVLINSSLVSAQNRLRYYWANFNITHPKNKNIKFSDIYENNNEIKPISEAKINRVMNTKFGIKKFADQTTEKVGTIISGYYKQPTDGWYVKRPQGVTMLTPTECEALQTLPYNYTDCVSNSQRYKAIGNGWTVDVIAHILKGMI